MAFDLRASLYGWRILTYTGAQLRFSSVAIGKDVEISKCAANALEARPRVKVALNDGNYLRREIVAIQRCDRMVCDPMRAATMCGRRNSDTWAETR